MLQGAALLLRTVPSFGSSLFYEVPFFVESMVTAGLGHCLEAFRHLRGVGAAGEIWNRTLEGTLLYSFHLKVKSEVRYCLLLGSD